jgi:AcrR family transcriptional regulator
MTKQSRHRPGRGEKASRPGQPGGVRDLNRKAKRQALLDAAMLLFLERGVEGVAVDDITAAAKTAKGSFYRYFDSQEALVEALVLPAHQMVVQALEECSADLETASTREAMFAAYRKVGGVVAGLMMEHPGVVRLYLQESRAPSVGARKPIIALSELVSRYAIEITVKAQAHGILKPIPAPVSALAVVGAAERLLAGVFLDEPLGNPLEIPELLTTLVLDGLRA